MSRPAAAAAPPPLTGASITCTPFAAAAAAISAHSSVPIVECTREHAARRHAGEHAGRPERHLPDRGPVGDAHADDVTRAAELHRIGGDRGPTLERLERSRRAAPRASSAAPSSIMRSRHAGTLAAETDEPGPGHVSRWTAEPSP